MPFARMTALVDEPMVGLWSREEIAGRPYHRSEARFLGRYLK